ncbi:hypothetical protein C8Q75DRAFT_879938 [Abortiporus biennis]|nr:hypothetical protein C8Q75DRAFT_879938 [Abortiporus biennis]
MTAVLQATDALCNDKMLGSNDDNYSSGTDWKAKYMEVADMLSETRAELDDFHISSKELEEELERELDRTEKAQRDLKIKVERAEHEKEEWKSKFMTLQTTHNTATTSLQRELDTLRQEYQRIKVQLRELEMGNDDLERNERAISSSLADAEQKYSRVLEEKILLEHELLDKANVEEESQRLKDELRDANEEISILKEQLSAATQRAATSSLSDLPASTISSHPPSDEESLLSTPAPADLQLSDLSFPPETPAKDFPPIPLPLKTPRTANIRTSTPPSHTSQLQRASFHPPKSMLSPTTSIPSPLMRSSTIPPFSGTPSRLPSRNSTPRMTSVKIASTASIASSSTAVPPPTKSRGVQMVSEMRARVKVLEQKIHTRVPLPRLRMGSVTSRSNGSTMPPPKAGSSAAVSSPAASSSSTSTTYLRANHPEDRSSTLKSRRTSIDSDSENRRTPAGDSSGWVLITDSPSPLKNKEKEQRRTSSPSAPSAFRPVSSNISQSPSPSGSSRAPSVLSQSAIPSRRPQSRLSVSTEGRSSISTNATTSTASSIPTPSSRPSTPTFLPVPSASLYQSQIGMKKSIGPGHVSTTQTKRSSFGSSTASPMAHPSHIPTSHSNVTLRPLPKVSASASFTQSRIGRPTNGRKSGSEDDTGGGLGVSKYGRGRAGSASALFGRHPL